MIDKKIEETVSVVSSKIRQVKLEISKVIVGLDRVVDELLCTLCAGGHALLEGMPGTGKTQLVRALCAAICLECKRIQFTPDLMPADILGSHILNTENSRILEFIKGPVFTNVLLADEINRCTPRTQAALLEAMQENSVTIAGETLPINKPFITVATQNPIEIEGTFPLPESQLDRFFFKISVPRPPLQDLIRIGSHTSSRNYQKIDQVLAKDEILEIQDLVRDVPVPQHVLEYTARIVLISSPDAPRAPDYIKDHVRFGASPRALQALLLGARVTALLDGRFSVSIEDIREVAMPALRHRLILNLSAISQGISAESLISELIS